MLSPSLPYAEIESTMQIPSISPIRLRELPRPCSIHLCEPERKVGRLVRGVSRKIGLRSFVYDNYLLQLAIKQFFLLLSNPVCSKKNSTMSTTVATKTTATAAARKPQRPKPNPSHRIRDPSSVRPCLWLFPKTLCPSDYFGTWQA